MLLDRIEASCPKYFLTTGLCPITAKTLNFLSFKKIIRLHYSTDDPWSPGSRVDWFLNSLPLYDYIFTPRKENMDDFGANGCTRVERVAFGYDEFLFGGTIYPCIEGGIDVLFVGGADEDRIGFLSSLVNSRFNIALVGQYWDRISMLKGYALGMKSPLDLIRLTKSAKVNLCLVRKSNRDGHVMRTFEIAALGGCMIVEDTEEHREIFGPEGESVLYFSTPEQASQKIRCLLESPLERYRLRDSVQKRILNGGNSYTNRLMQIIQLASGGH
jgi:hypothetical protein